MDWTPSEHEWLRAAVTLQYREQEAAFFDISEMTGRSIEAIRREAYRLVTKALDDKIKAEAARKKAEHEACLRRKREAIARRTAMGSSSIPPPSKERLTSGR